MFSSVVISHFDRRLQPPLDEMKERSITPPPRHTFPEICVRNFIEIPGDIGVYDLGMVLPERFVDLAHSVFRTALGAIPLGGVIKLRLKDRLQHELGRPLCHPVTDRRNS